MWRCCGAVMVLAWCGCGAIAELVCCYGAVEILLRNWYGDQAGVALLRCCCTLRVSSSEVSWVRILSDSAAAASLHTQVYKIATHYNNTSLFRTVNLKVCGVRIWYISAACAITALRIIAYLMRNNCGTIAVLMV